MNNVSIVGRLTRDPELKYTNSNTAVVSFTVAVNRPYKDKQTGEYEADFIRCQAWRKTAELISQYGYKGMRVGVEGRIQTRSYEGQNGQVFVTEVIADQFHFLESKSERSNNQQPNTNRQQNNNFNDSFEDDIHIDDGDLPF